MLRDERLKESKGSSRSTIFHEGIQLAFRQRDMKGEQLR